MEKRFAIIAVIVMCAVFAFIFVQHRSTQQAEEAAFLARMDEEIQQNIPGDIDNDGDEEEEQEYVVYEYDEDSEEDEEENLVAYERSNDDMELPIVTITMQNGGVIKLELYPEIAPNTVNNFINLANDGFYDGLIFHRVIPGFMIQGGCPNGTGGGNPGYSIVGEFAQNRIPNPLRHERGVISMARAQPFDSAGSQFFIMHADGFFLDGAYAGFGRVIEGIEVVDQIAMTITGAQDRPVDEQVIETIRVETFGVDFPAPETLGR